MIISTICFNSLWKGLRIYTKNSRNPIKNFPPASYYVYKSPFPEPTLCFSRRSLGSFIEIPLET